MKNGATTGKYLDVAPATLFAEVVFDTPLTLEAGDKIGMVVYAPSGGITTAHSNPTVLAYYYEGAALG
jgi:hypothetical protein